MCVDHGVISCLSFFHNTTVLTFWHPLKADYSRKKFSDLLSNSYGKADGSLWALFKFSVCSFRTIMIDWSHAIVDYFCKLESKDPRKL